MASSAMAWPSHRFWREGDTSVTLAARRLGIKPGTVSAGLASPRVSLCDEGTTKAEEAKMEAVEFKDLPGLVGQEVGVSDWLQVTQERVNQFADATGDHQWIHVDVERATREIGGPIAHGYLTLSLIPHLSAGMLPVKGVTRGINYGSDKVRFT